MLNLAKIKIKSVRNRGDSRRGGSCWSCSRGTGTRYSAATTQSPRTGCPYGLMGKLTFFLGKSLNLVANQFLIFSRYFGRHYCPVQREKLSWDHASSIFQFNAVDCLNPYLFLKIFNCKLTHSVLQSVNYGLKFLFVKDGESGYFLGGTQQMFNLRIDPPNLSGIHSLRPKQVGVIVADPELRYRNNELSRIFYWEMDR